MRSVTYLRGWPRGRWWNSPMLFWDDFSSDGELGPEPAARNASGSLCLQREIAPGARGRLHLPAGLALPQPHAGALRLDARPRATRTTIIGNHYCHPLRRRLGRRANTRPRTWTGLEKRTRALRRRHARNHAARRGEGRRHAPTSPRWPRTTCFRTADGEFHGFEGANDQTRLLLRQLHARLELRNRDARSCSRPWRARCAKRPSATRLDDAGAHALPPACCPTASRRSGIRRRRRPDGPDHASSISTGSSPATREWLRGIWPQRQEGARVRLDAGRLGRRPRRRHGRRAAQHLRRGVLRAESACAASTTWARCAPARRWRARWATARSRGRIPPAVRAAAAAWIDANLFNGEYYIQKVRGIAQGQDRHRRCAATWARTTPSIPITRWARAAWSTSWSASTWRTSPASARCSIRRTSARRCESIYRYNYKRTLARPRVRAAHLRAERRSRRW